MWAPLYAYKGIFIILVVGGLCVCYVGPYIDYW